MVSLVGRIQDMSVDSFKNIRLCLANILFSEGCRACVKGGELSTIDWPLVDKGEEMFTSRVGWGLGEGYSPHLQPVLKVREMVVNCHTWKLEQHCSGLLLAGSKTG